MTTKPLAPKSLASARHSARSVPVTITTRVIRAEGREVTFQVEARDEQEMVARGLHKRAIIRVEGFARRVAAKKSG